MNKVLVRAATAIVSAACLVSATATASPKKDAFVGNWVLNAGKSTYDPGPALQNGKVAIEAMKGGTKVTIDVTLGDGKTAHIAYAGATDGTDVAVTGSMNYDTVTFIRPDHQTMIRTERRAGKVVSITTATVSADGKTITSEGRGSTATGQKFHNVTVWDRAKH